MFDTLADRLQEVFTKLRSHGRLSEAQVDSALREVRLALLEADVNFKVVRDFVARVRERAVGEEVTRSLTPAQQVIKIVHEELIVTLGERNVPLTTAPRPPTVVMLAGLQGSGKTTTGAKLARHLASKGRKPLLVACDLQRPAAVRQLQVLGGQAKVPVFAPADGSAPADPVAVAAGGLEEADRTGRDVVIVDTAGRLAIDAEMMAQAAAIADRIAPTEVLLVVDAMTGQDAVQTAVAFKQGVDVTGVILCKLDGDARGGAALSIRSVTGVPIKFATTGEKLADFEPFHPDRLAGRILGMGDVLTLIERAEELVDRQEAERMERKLREASFTLEDFLQQLQQVKKMGPLNQVLGMLPGMSRELKGIEVDDRDLARVEAVIRSMTPAERVNPKILNGSRRARIARGSGTTTQQVNAVLKQFDEARRMMKQLAGMSPKRLRKLGLSR
ncbi:MAG TPA: signal recognition particle protein [Actinomycetes bacterium]|nr:signal recognition particle protein [Actinomycetes bacterium]